MILRRLSIGLILLTSLSALAGDEIWDRKPPEEWGAKDCEKILEASPWVRRDAGLLPRLPLQGQPGSGGVGSLAGADEGGTGGGRSRGSSSTNDAADRSLGRPNMVYFRWRSARIIRQAIVRDLQLRGTIKEELARKFVDNPVMEKSLVLSVSADSAPQLFGLVRNKEDAIRSASYIEKKNKQRIPVERVLPMDLKKGDLDLLLVFPREVDGKPAVTLEDQEAEFVFVVGDKKIRQKYRLDKMLVGGNLDI